AVLRKVAEARCRTGSHPPDGVAACLCRARPEPRVAIRGAAGGRARRLLTGDLSARRRRGFRGKETSGPRAPHGPGGRAEALIVASLRWDEAKRAAGRTARPFRVLPMANASPGPLDGRRRVARPGTFTQVPVRHESPHRAPALRP